MKKSSSIFLGSIILVASIMIPNAASASKVHSGLPKVIQNKAYSAADSANRPNYNYVGIGFKKDTIWFLVSTDGGNHVTHLKYKATGSRSYYITGKISGTKQQIHLVFSKNYKTLKYKNTAKHAFNHQLTTYKYYGHQFRNF